MKQPFNETRMAKGRDPVDARGQDFDWAELYRILDEDLPEAQADKLIEEVLIRLIDILVPRVPGRIIPYSLGLRLLALVWLLRPDHFGDTPSLRRLARRASVTPSKLSRHAGKLSRLLRWRNRGQRHAWNWGKGQRSALK